VVTRTWSGVVIALDVGVVDRACDAGCVPVEISNRYYVVEAESAHASFGFFDMWRAPRCSSLYS
jgi:hypothetical protein